MDDIYNRINTGEYVAPGTVESWYLYYHIWLNNTKSDELLNRTNTCQKIATGWSVFSGYPHNANCCLKYK